PPAPVAHTTPSGPTETSEAAPGIRVKPVFGSPSTLAQTSALELMTQGTPCGVTAILVTPEAGAWIQFEFPSHLKTLPAAFETQTEPSPPMAMRVACPGICCQPPLEGFPSGFRQICPALFTTQGRPS